MKNTVTRFELWKNYRLEIEENIALQQSVRNSNEKLKILYERLLKVFPNYETKYSTKLQSFKLNLEKIAEVPVVSTHSIEEIIENINELEEEQFKLSPSFDDLDFSTKVLDQVIEAMRQGVNKQKLKDQITRTTNVVIKSPQTINVLKPFDKKISVAIDGPSGAGKSTIARKIAKKWHLFYLNTGLVYRAIALKAIISKIKFEDKVGIFKLLKPNMISLNVDETVELDGQDVTLESRSDEVSQLASKLSTYPEVRKYALDIQRSYAKTKGVIAEGRDTTFRVIPDADVKIYLDTLPEVRAQRRVSQNAELGYNTNYDEILEQIIERDERDKSRAIDPLHQTKDAIYINASYLPIDEVIDQINDIIKAKIENL